MLASWSKFIFISLRYRVIRNPMMPKAFIPSFMANKDASSFLMEVMHLSVGHTMSISSKITAIFFEDFISMSHNSRLSSQRSVVICIKACPARTRLVLDHTPPHRVSANEFLHLQSHCQGVDVNKFCHQMVHLDTQILNPLSEISNYFLPQ